MDFSMPIMNGLDAASHKFLEQRAYKAGVSLVLSKEESMSRVADCARILS